MRHEFHTGQWVPYPRERVFAFFANPANLPPLMPGWQHARIERANYVAPEPDPSQTGFAAGKGSAMTISFRPLPLLPIRLEWDAYITDFRWNDFFCDEQRRGPFRYFRHCHRLREEARDGLAGTVVTDAVDYELPLGFLGDIANVLFMKFQIALLFRHRQKTLLQLLKTQPASPSSK